MKAEVFCICDSAEVRNGFLKVEGIHSRKLAPFFPCVLPSLTLAAYIRFDADEEGEQSIALRLTDLDGKVLAETASGKLLVKTEPALTHTWIHWIGTVTNIPLREANEYAVELLFSGRSAASTILLVSLKPPTPT